jgi:hypothetical protein
LYHLGFPKSKIDLPYSQLFIGLFPIIIRGNAPGGGADMVGSTALTYREWSVPFERLGGGNPRS